MRWDEGPAEPRLSGEGARDGGAIPVTCPVTAASCLRQPFVALPGCGHVLAAKALEHVQGSCPLCGAPFEGEEVVGLMGDAAELARLRAMLPDRRKKGRGGGRKRRRQEDPSHVTR